MDHRDRLGFGRPGRVEPGQDARTAQARLLRRSFTRLIRRTDEWNLRGLYWYAWRDTDVGKAVCGWCARAGLRDRKGRPKPAFQRAPPAGLSVANTRSLFRPVRGGQSGHGSEADRTGVEGSTGRSWSDLRVWPETPVAPDRPGDRDPSHQTVNREIHRLGLPRPVDVRRAEVDRALERWDRDPDPDLQASRRRPSSRSSARSAGCAASGAASEAVARRRTKVKQQLVEEAGGRCELCGYSRCARALQFHHRDPSQKSFGIAMRGITQVDGEGPRGGREVRLALLELPRGG